MSSFICVSLKRASGPCGVRSVKGDSYSAEVPQAAFHQDVEVVAEALLARQFDVGCSSKQRAFDDLHDLLRDCVLVHCVAPEF